MRLLKFIPVVFCLMLILQSKAQNIITMLDSGRNTSLRGLSVVNDKVVWASGSNGTIARSIDGGKTFEWLTVKGFEQRDFRDVEAFDANTALIMAVDEPAIILKTKDGGKHWNKVFVDSTKGMFLDAMDFNNKGDGIVIGDPINNKAFIAFTKDEGEHWIVNNNILKDTLITGEAFFASSGTNIKLLSITNQTPHFLAVSGGKKSQVISKNFIQIPISQGEESTGANSIAINSDQNCVIVGGDFTHDSISNNNCVLFNYKGNDIKFSKPQISPHGYRSCVAFITRNKLICCGTSGVDISDNGGINWQLISNESFHVCQKAKNGNAVFLAGGNGGIAKLQE